MTADDIIAANPHLTWRHALIGDVDGLIYTDADGIEVWVIWKGDKHVASRMPWTLPLVQIAKQRLDAALAAEKESDVKKSGKMAAGKEKPQGRIKGSGVNKPVHRETVPQVKPGTTYGRPTATQKL